MVAMAAYMRADWWNSTFLNGKLPERKFMNQNFLTPSRFEDMLCFGKGAQCASLAWIGLKGHSLDR